MPKRFVKRRRTRKGKVSKSVKTYVQKQLVKTLEKNWIIEATISDSILTIDHRHLGLVGQGDGQGKRTGDEIIPLRANYTLTMTGTVNASTARLMVVQLRRGIREVSGGWSIANMPQSVDYPWTQEQRDQMIILYDRRFTFASGGDNLIRIVKINILRKKLKKMLWQPSSTTAVAPDDGGAIILAYVADYPVTITGYAMLEYLS